jgi:tetrahydromethanopterin S-methyltransferase subunit G
MKKKKENLDLRGEEEDVDYMAKLVDEEDEELSKAEAKKSRLAWGIFFGVIVALIIACIIVIVVLQP